jgi:hypothetical protein
MTCSEALAPGHRTALGYLLRSLKYKGDNRAGADGITGQSVQPGLVDLYFSEGVYLPELLSRQLACNRNPKGM